MDEAPGAPTPHEAFNLKASFKHHLAHADLITYQPQGHREPQPPGQAPPTTPVPAPLPFALAGAAHAPTAAVPLGPSTFLSVLHGPPAALQGPALQHRAPPGRTLGHSPGAGWPLQGTPMQPPQPHSAVLLPPGGGHAAQPQVRPTCSA